MRKWMIFIWLVLGVKGLMAQKVERTLITVSGGTYEKAIFREGGKIWINRDYVIQGVPKVFEGFEVLRCRVIMAKRGESLSGVEIKAREQGTLYLLARPSEGMKSVLGKQGWKLLNKTQLQYHTPQGDEPLAIYTRKAETGEVISLPLVKDFGGVMPLASEIHYEPAGLEASEITVRVTGKEYQPGHLVEGGRLWINREYVARGIPKAFEGFEMLITAVVPRGGESPEEVMIPETTGKLYVVARRTKAVLAMMASEGWHPLPQTDFMYDTPQGSETLCIFSKPASAGKKVYIPVVRDFGGVLPLAKQIQYTQP